MRRSSVLLARQAPRQAAGHIMTGPSVKPRIACRMAFCLYISAMHCRCPEFLSCSSSLHSSAYKSLSFGRVSFLRSSLHFYRSWRNDLGRSFSNCITLNF